MSDDDEITIDLTGRYAANWMQRGRTEMQYREALRDYLIDDGYPAADAERVMENSSINGGLSILEEEWDEIWAVDEDPAEAMLTYLGEETVEAVAEDDYKTKHQNRTRQKAEYRPHMKDVFSEYFDD